MSLIVTTVIKIREGDTKNHNAPVKRLLRSFKLFVMFCFIIQGVKITYNVNFYITKYREVQWISASEQYLKGKRSHGKIESVIKVSCFPKSSQKHN